MTVRTIRNFAVVRETWAGLLMLGISLAVGLAFSSHVLTEFGPIALAVPLPVLLVVPAIAGIGAGMASVEDLRMPLPDPPLLARAGWALAFTAVAAAIALAGLALSDAATPAAVVRNVVLHAGLALLLARTDGRVLWLPGVLLTLMAMLFGQGSAGREVATWAFALDPTVEPSHLGITGVVYLLGLAAVTWPRRDRLRGRPVSPRTPPGARP